MLLTVRHKFIYRFEKQKSKGARKNNKVEHVQKHLRKINIQRHVYAPLSIKERI